MRLENVLALTDGLLVSEPFVSSFTNVVFDASDVKRGDLFLAFEEENISEAVFNGAYGVMFCRPVQISDSEIAWIKVENLELALKRLLRFRLIDKNVTVYETNEIVLKLALQITTESNFLAINGTLQDIAKQLWNIEEHSTLLFCPQFLDKKIFAKSIELSDTSHQHINIVEQTLFETSFIYDDIFYERQLISPFFIPYLEILLNLFKNLKINYRLKKFAPIGHFEAVFTNKRFEIKEFGTSDKVLIFEKQSSFIESEVHFLQKEAKWAKIVYVLPYSEESIISKIVDTNSLIIYKNENEILNLLQHKSFHFALIIGATKEILSKPLVNQTEISLFDFRS